MRLARVPAVVILVVAVLLAAGEPAQAAVNDPGLPMQWGLHLVGAEKAWATGTGNGITIAVVDSGFYFGHEDYASGKVLPGRNFVEEGAPPADDVGHGTHVTGIAAASANNCRGVAGVAPDARILPVRVLAYDKETSSGTGTSDDVTAGIKWAVDNGAHVVNVSLGAELQPLLGPSFVEAIRYSWDRGVIVVVAAGNDDFVTGSGFRNESALVVSATNRSDAKASYATGVGQAKWGLVAPGGEGSEADAILSTYWTSENNPSTYAYASGTSMAAPHVAGAAAVLRGLGLTAQQTVDRLRQTAKDLGAAGRDATYGDGRIDLAKAVAGLQPKGGGSTAGTTSCDAGRITTTTTARRGTTPTTKAPARSGTTAPRGEVTTAPSVTPTSVPDGTLDIVPAGPEAAAPEAGAPSAGRGDGGEDSDEPMPWPPPLLATGLLLAVSGGIVRARRA